MVRRFSATVALLALAAAGCANGAEEAHLVPSLADSIAALPRGGSRIAGPSLADSMAAAKAAFDHCAARDALVSVMVADAEGAPIVLLSGDGAGVRSGMIVRTKVATVLRFGMAAREVQALAESDPAIARDAAVDPDIGVLRSGAFPVTRDGKMFAVVAVSGALGRPELDDECALLAAEMLQDGSVSQ